MLFKRSLEFQLKNLLYENGIEKIRRYTFKENRRSIRSTF